MCWHTIILSWSDLSKEIRGMQAKNPAYMKNFEDLYTQLNEYKQLHYKDFNIEANLIYSNKNFQHIIIELEKAC